LPEHLSVGVPNLTHRRDQNIKCHFCNENCIIIRSFGKQRLMRRDIGFSKSDMLMIHIGHYKVGLLSSTVIRLKYHTVEPLCSRLISTNRTIMYVASMHLCIYCPCKIPMHKIPVIGLRNNLIRHTQHETLFVFNNTHTFFGNIKHVK